VGSNPRKINFNITEILGFKQNRNVFPTTTTLKAALNEPLQDLKISFLSLYLLTKDIV
jgi:hypothetical protein